MTLLLRSAVVAFCAVLGVAVLPAAQQRAQWPREAPPRPLPASPVAFPDYQVKTLANGLQVVAVPHHEQPAVSYRLLIRAGAANDAADRPGVASFVAALLDQGTTTRSAEQVANAIESAGGLMSVGAGNEVTYVSGAVVKDQVTLALELAADVAQRPAFAPDEIQRQKDSAISSLQVSADDPSYIANALIDRLVFGFHPYGRPGPTTMQAIQGISRDDLVAFHRTWFVPNNALLAIVGDLTTDEAFAAAERAFGSWARRDVPAVTFDEAPPPTRRVVVVDRPGAVQTTIRVGQRGVSRTYPEYTVVDLMMRILGGEGANRLFGVLRGDRGLTYGASAAFRAFRTEGSFIAETDTRSEATGEALRLMINEVARLQREPVDARELRGAQDYMAGSFPLTIESPAAIAMQVLNSLFFGLSLDTLETYREDVNRVTPADIQRVAKTLLAPDRLSIVLVGDASVFAGQLKAAGIDSFERIPVADLDLSAPSLRRTGRD